MPIYTKTGDDGTTALFGGKRVKKYDAQIEAYGNVDELTSYMGLVIAKINNEDHATLLTTIQKDLYRAMGTLCGAETDLSNLTKRVKDFETTIDALDISLPKLTRFILPQGGEVAVLLHITRTICRRAERGVVRFFDTNKVVAEGKIIVQYLNRLSDLLFTMARYYNRGNEITT